MQKKIPDEQNVNILNKHKIRPYAWMTYLTLIWLCQIPSFQNIALKSYLS